jgi:hypothetical protein
MSTFEAPSSTQVSTTTRLPTALSSAAAAYTLTSNTTPGYAKVSYKKRRSSTDQSSSGDEAVGKQGGSVPPDKCAAARGAGTSYNRFNLLPLVNLDAQVTQKSSSDEAKDIPLINPRIKDRMCKRKWKHSRCFPAQHTSSDSAEELLRTAIQQRSQDSYKMSKKAGDWTAKEWAMILGIKWPIRDIDHMEFLPTKTSASTIRTRKTKKQKASHKEFTAEQWSKILWPASKAKKKLAKCWAMITAWEEPKKSPQKPIKPKDQKPRSGVDQKSFDLASFIQTGKLMKEEQKHNFIRQSMTDDSLSWMSPTAWARLLNVKSVFTSRYKSLRIPTLLQSLHTRAERQVLVDSGSTDNFISHKLLKRMKIGTLELKYPRVIWNVDGTHNRSGMIKKFADLQV